MCLKDQSHFKYPMCHTDAIEYRADVSWITTVIPRPYTRIILKNRKYNDVEY